MKKLAIGDVTITSIIERDGPWRRPEDMFPAYDPAIGKRHLAELDPEVFDPASGRMVITYQTYVVRTGKHTILVDTCTGEDKGYAAPMDFPKQPWLDGFAAAGLRFEDIDYVFCTHLHIDHCGWNTVLRDGRWVPTFPKAKYIFHKREYAVWEEATKRPARQCLALQLRTGGRRRSGAPGRRRFYARRHHLADADAGPFAMPLLRQYPFARTAGGGHRRPDASRAAMPRAGLVDDLLLGSEAGGAVAPQVSRRDGWDRHVRVADPFSPSDGRACRGRRRAISLQVCSLNRASRAGSCARL
jgi:hypothetical protein